MPLRIVKKPVQVYRNGGFVGFEPSDKAEEFSAEEVASINEADPEALGKIVIEDAQKAAPVEAKKTA